ncbi:hypothetical protein JHK87_033439 [Glycine soja]|nr:hypothetical protein JHK87_033439 [Glycine soja]
MAAGWNSQLVVETWSQGGRIATSVGLAVARSHTCGRHVCVVSNERVRSKYVERIGKVGVMMDIMGLPGAYTEDAALKAYPKCETVPCEDFETSFKLLINHCLLGLPGVRKEDLKAVMSHPQDEDVNITHFLILARDPRIPRNDMAYKIVRDTRVVNHDDGGEQV